MGTPFVFDFEREAQVISHQNQNTATSQRGAETSSSEKTE
jgi:hypothetical protein